MTSQADREIAEAARLGRFLATGELAARYTACCRYELLASESRTVGLECSYHSDPAACVQRGMGS